MRLALIDDDGTVIEIEREIENYNLEKPIARAEICNMIQKELERLRAPAKPNEPPCPWPEDCECQPEAEPGKDRLATCVNGHRHHPQPLGRRCPYCLVDEVADALGVK